MANPNNTEVIEATPEMRQTLKRNYFSVNKAKFPSFFAGNVLLAYLFTGLAIFIIFYFEMSVATFIFSLILVFFSFVYTFRWLKPYYNERQKFTLTPSTDQMENWLIEDIRNKVKPAAVEMLSLNPATITPDNFIIIPHPVWWSVEGVPQEDIVRKQSENGYFVYSVYNISVFALTENYISYYHCTYDWLSDIITNPYTLEFFFDDISSIRAEVQPLNYKPFDYFDPPPQIDEETGKVIDPPPPPTVGSANVVIVRNKSGETMDAIVTIPSLASSPRITLRPEKVMQTLRIMLRNRRYGEEFEIIRPPDED